MIKKVKVHQGCIGQANVALRRAEPPAAKCSCKKTVEYSEANNLVKTGEAKWVVTKRTRGSAEVLCVFCINMTTEEKKTCARCKGEGKVLEPKIWEDFNNDIVLLGDDREGFKSKTPRVATVEKKHIYRAFVDKLAYAVQRIEEYGKLSKEIIIELGAELRDFLTNEILESGKPEPKNDPHMETGERYDYGRAPFAHGSTLLNQYDEGIGRVQSLVIPSKRPVDFDSVPESFYEIGWWKKNSPFALEWEQANEEKADTDEEENDLDIGDTEVYFEPTNHEDDYDGWDRAETAGDENNEEDTW